MRRISPEEIYRIILKARGKTENPLIPPSTPREAWNIIHDLRNKGLDDSQIEGIIECVKTVAQTVSAQPVHYKPDTDFPLGLTGPGGLPVISKKLRPTFSAALKIELKQKSHEPCGLFAIEDLEDAVPAGYTPPDIY
jgi:hypothetical protein